MAEIDLQKWAESKLSGESFDDELGGGDGEGGEGEGGAPLFNTNISVADLPEEYAAWVESGEGGEPPSPIPGDDEESYAYVLEQVQRDWGAYEDPWATVAFAYIQLTGANGEGEGEGDPDEGEGEGEGEGDPGEFLE